jgi:hypothetical protein
MKEGTDVKRPGRDFLVRWCIVLAVIALCLGFVLPYLVPSPPYPQRLSAVANLPVIG